MQKLLILLLFSTISCKVGAELNFSDSKVISPALDSRNYLTFMNEIDSTGFNLLPHPIILEAHKGKHSHFIFLKKDSFAKGRVPGNYFYIKFHKLPNLAACKFGINLQLNSRTFDIDEINKIEYKSFIEASSQEIVPAGQFQWIPKNFLYLLDRELGGNYFKNVWVVGQGGSHVFSSKKVKEPFNGLDAIDVYIDAGWVPDSLSFRVKNLDAFERSQTFVLGDLHKKKDNLGRFYFRTYLTPEQKKMTKNFSGRYEVREFTVALLGNKNDVLLSRPINKVVFQSQNFWDSSLNNFIDSDTFYSYDKNKGVRIYSFPNIDSSGNNSWNNLEISYFSENRESCALVIDSVGIAHTKIDIAKEPKSDAVYNNSGEDIQDVLSSEGLTTTRWVLYAVAIVLTLVGCILLGSPFCYGLTCLLTSIFLLFLGLKQSTNSGSTNYFFLASGLICTIFLRELLVYLTRTFFKNFFDLFRSSTEFSIFAYFIISIIFLSLSTISLIFVSDIIAGQLANIAYSSLWLMFFSCSGVGALFISKMRNPKRDNNSTHKIL